MVDISIIANNCGISDITKYGNYIAKINSVSEKLEPSKLILVTAVNPTPYGEGKTTVSIGLVDALNKLNLNAGGVLREPSLGPVFGIKGGATGGGKASIVPSDDINLHFTGDFHAITAANNLLASAIYNHIYQGNTLGIKDVTFKRCIDMNDRDLRDKFNITAASEVMSVFCMATDIFDLKRRLGNIIVGLNNENNFVYAKNLHVEGAMTVLLKDAFKPNLVQTVEGSPVLVHGGPFANISLGVNSIVATNMALKTFDFVVTEAGFGADLGAEKFLDIETKLIKKVPDAVVLIVTCRSVEYNGGLDNLKVHLENLHKFGVNVVVAINKFETDSDESINNITNFLDSVNVLYSIVTSFKDGSFGSIDLAEKVRNLSLNSINYIYDKDNDIKEKISKLATNIYHANNVNYSEESENAISMIRNNNIDYPICVAKTQYSISDDPKKLGYPKNFDITVKNIKVMNGAELIVVYLNDIMTLPGLSKNPNYENIDIDNNGNIIGIE